MTTATTIRPTWQGLTCAILTDAPSTESANLAKLDGIPVIVINSAYQRYRHAHTLFSGDWRFFEGRNFCGFYGKEIVCCSPRAWREYGGVATHARAIYVERGAATGLETRRTHVSGRHTCVGQAISFAVHRGVKRLLLIGLDLKPAENGMRYAFGVNPDTDDCLRRYADMAKNLETFVAPLRARGVEVINCNPNSAFTSWRRANLEDVI